MKPKISNSTEKQLLINKVALDLFVQNGYHNTSVDSITRKAGISKGLIYHYYNSKKEIVQTIVEDSIHRLIKEFDPFNLPLQNIELDDLFKQPIDILNSNIPFWKLSYQILIDHNYFHQEYNMIYQQIDEPFYNMLMDFFSYKGSKNPEIYSSLFMAFVNGVFFNILFKKEKLHYESISQLKKYFQFYK